VYKDVLSRKLNDKFLKYRFNALRNLTWNKEYYRVQKKRNSILKIRIYLRSIHRQVVSAIKKSYNKIEEKSDNLN